jgi:hypothetical protein
MSDALATTPGQGVNVFGDAGGGQVQKQAMESAVTSREQSEVQAAIIMAKRFPRDQVQAMDRILTACGRPTLAMKAQYQYARGGTDISGPSIRLAEEILRGWGNIVSGIRELSRGFDEKGIGFSECVAYAWDLETNVRDERYFRVRHWRDTRSGGYALKDERDIYEAVANSGARRKRASMLAMIPGDVQEEAVKTCEATLQSNFEITPESIKAMVDRFGQCGVTKDQMEARIQRRIDTITPALYASMVKIYNSINDGMSTALDWFDFGDSLEADSTGDRTASLNARIAAMRDDPDGNANTQAEPESPKDDDDAKPPAKPEETPKDPAPDEPPSNDSESANKAKVRKKERDELKTEATGLMDQMLSVGLLTNDQYKDGEKWLASRVKTDKIREKVELWKAKLDEQASASSPDDDADDGTVDTPEGDDAPADEDNPHWFWPIWNEVVTPDDEIIGDDTVENIEEYFAEKGGSVADLREISIDGHPFGEEFPVDKLDAVIQWVDAKVAELSGS